MTEIEQQVRGWWSRLIAWLRGAQHSDAARKARDTMQDVRTSDAGRRAEAARRVRVHRSRRGRPAGELIKAEGDEKEHHRPE